MKILQILCSQGFGGLEKHMSDLANGLVARHEVVVLSSDDHRSRLDERVRLESFDVTGWRSNPFLLWKLVKILRREKPDVIHAQGNKAADMLAAIRRFVPGVKVGTVHGLKRDVRGFEKLNGAIAVSRGITAPFRKPKNVFVIPNGVDPAGLSSKSRAEVRAAMGWGDEPVVLAVGRLAQVKGFDLLIDAFEGAANGEGARLVIAGEGGERAKLEALAAKKNIVDRVDFLGHREDVSDLMRGADLLAISSHREGFSYVMAEALVSELPVLAMRVNGVEDRLPEAFLIPQGAVEAFRSKLQVVLKDLEGTRATFKPVFEAARAELTLDSMVKAVEGVYQTLTKS